MSSSEIAGGAARQTELRVDVITLFPQLFEPFISTSLLGRAVTDGILQMGLHDLRQHGLGKHLSVDDEPYGGGAGMVMRAEPLAAAIESVASPDSHVILLSPRGRRLTHPEVARLARERHLVLICGRYEGIDQRISDLYVDEEISIGDYVLAGGELPAMVLIEAVARHVPGVLGNPGSLVSESHVAGQLEYPQYTRPPEFRGLEVPPVLLSGDHAAIERWRREQSALVTRARRQDPDLEAGEDVS